MLEREQAELASRCRYFDETEDEYAGLMSQRDKQFIINIQLSQLKCDNPFIDDYYYTMFTAKKEASESSNEPHFLLNESGDAEAEYVPTQFHNSLGRLQVVTVKAPRQIIDLGVMRCPDTPPSPPTTIETSVAPGATVVKTQAKRVDYKQVLLQIERLYFILLEVEALKLKLSAIPTGAPLREQVTLELTTQIQLLVSSLNKLGLITQMLQVRKGRGLLSRCLSHLPGAAVAKVSQEMTSQLTAVCRESIWSEKVWPHLARYISQASLGSLEAAVASLMRASSSPLPILLASPLGINAILALLHRAATAAKRGQDKISVPVWREVITKLLATLSDTSIATPLGRT
jgi:DNA topoisomerase 2-associated protein PAT1